MIIREKTLEMIDFDIENAMEADGDKEFFKKAIYFDLEHCVYKVPICVGVFGCCYYSQEDDTIKITQYMIEDKGDSRDILVLAKRYFNDMYHKLGKRYVVTFAGNNDFSVINALLKKYNVNIDIREMYKEIDIQKEYQKETDIVIGLKNLESKFDIIREGELVSGTNLSKTFAKIVKDNSYSSRMPESKKENILLYNEQDVVNLLKINLAWKKYMSQE